jgi:hypothetical protein
VGLLVGVPHPHRWREVALTRRKEESNNSWGKDTSDGERWGEAKRRLLRSPGSILADVVPRKVYLNKKKLTNR